MLNIHTSLLPKYRGPAPVLWAIRNGDPETGLTVHRMDARFDAGPILAQRGGIALDEDVTPRVLWSRLRPVLPDLHNQVRMFAFMGRDRAPVARIGDSSLHVFRTRLEPADGLRVECADAPIWIVDSAPATPR